MSLSPGTRLGPYEVQSLVGAGGMGEVYRARDSKLGRDVALKVLPEAFAADADRLARFEREAKTLAALNHPNIATVYGMAEGDRVHGLVMELVAGDDLAALIGRGPIPLAEAVPIARQIIDALEAAHEQGIVHRDLKPANIKIRPDGTVKILDFGLAKALDPTSQSGADLMNSPTLTARATQLGMVLGTAAYMAPEQARGKAVDRRADVWAFGVVLYEMLTGRRAFEGDDVSVTLAGVLKDEVDWSTLPAGVPASVRRLLRRCLEKDPRRRLSAIGDARWDLDEADAPAASLAAAQPAILRGWPPLRVAAVVLAAVAVAAVAGWLIAGRLHSPPAAIMMRSSILPPEKATLLVDSSAVAISPDGRWVAYVTGDVASFAGQLWVRRIDSLVAHRVEGADAVTQPFWSPDSRQVGFFTKSKLMRVPAAGGRAEEICDVQDSRGGTWNADDVIVMAPANGGALARISASGGTPTPVTVLDGSRGQTGHRFPFFLPDGNHFLYDALPAHVGEFDVYIGSLDGGKPELLMKAESAPIYTSGFLLFDHKGGLVAQPFDPARRTLLGAPQSLQDVPGGVSSLYFGNAAVSASTSGTMAYLVTPPTNTALVWFDLSGHEIGHVDVPPGSYEAVAVSPDGKRAVAERRTSPSSADLWVVDLVRGGATRLTTAPGVNFFPIWSPDGQTIAYSGDRDGPEAIYRRASNGAGGDELLYTNTTTMFKQPQSWSPDGRYIVYLDTNPVTNQDLWLLPTSGPHVPVPYVQGPSNEASGRISPDGRWMVYVSDETGTPEAYVQAFPKPLGKFRVTTSGASAAWWRADSKQLLILNSDSTQVLEADVLAGAEFATATPKVIGQLPKGIQGADVTTDLKRLLALRIEGGNVNMSITLVQNWSSQPGKVW